MRHILVPKLNVILLFFFTLAIVVRTVWLGNIPGINGDEALLGIRAMNSIDFSQRTNSGNFQSFFYLLPLMVIQKLFLPGFLALRLVALLSGLGVIICGYFLLRKSIGARAALFFVMMSAGLPILVAYSRFGWEPSQSGLITLFVVYFSLQKKWAAVLVAQVIAINIHPTNAFLVFIPLNLFILEILSKINWPVPEARIWVLILLEFVFLGGLYIFASHNYIEYAAGWLSEHNLKQIAVALKGVKYQKIFYRIGSLTDWRDLFILYGDLISGVTIYRYIVGPVSRFSVTLHNLLFWLCIAPIIIYGCWRKNQKKEYSMMAILLGVLFGMILMYIFWGTQPMSPNFERYNQFLVIPTLILFVTGLDSLNIKLSLPLSVIVCVFWFVSLALNYFMPFLLTGGQSHQTFRTAQIEPKEQAVEIILSNIQDDNNGLVLAENWWVAKPIQYLLVNHNNINVVQYDEAGNNIDPFIVLENNGFVVSFSQSELDQTILASRISTDLQKWIILDYGGRPLINVWHLAH